MEQLKTPKPVTYAKLGKGGAKHKNSNAESGRNDAHNKIARNSTGNLYEELMDQMQFTHNKYIRDLVARNQEDIEKEQFESKNFKEKRQEQRKSLTQLIPNQSQKKSQFKQLLEREQRMTIANSKSHINKSYLSYQVTPKNSQVKNQFSKNLIQPQSTRIDSASIKPFLSSNLKECLQSSFHKDQGPSFLGSIDQYLSSLKSHQNSIQKMTSEEQSKIGTVKNRNQAHNVYELTAKLENSMSKIKELKLKNHLLEKQQAKFLKKQKKMKQNMYEMLDEIRYLNGELANQKKQRKKMQKIIENFEVSIQKCKPQWRNFQGRSTVNVFSNTMNHQKNGNLRQFAQNILNQDASSSASDSHYQSRLIGNHSRDDQQRLIFNTTQNWKNKLTNSKNRNNGKLSHQKYGKGQRNIGYQYDEQKIQNLFRSHQVSDQSDSN